MSPGLSRALCNLGGVCYRSGTSRNENMSSYWGCNDFQCSVLYTLPHILKTWSFSHSSRSHCFVFFWTGGNDIEWADWWCWRRQSRCTGRRNWPPVLNWIPECDFMNHFDSFSCNSVIVTTSRCLTLFEGALIDWSIPQYVCLACRKLAPMTSNTNNQTCNLKTYKGYLFLFFLRQFPSWINNTLAVVVLLSCH